MLEFYRILPHIYKIQETLEIIFIQNMNSRIPHPNETKHGCYARLPTQSRIPDGFDQTTGCGRVECG